MKRKAYGRDRGLTLRMILTTGALGLLYVTFAVVLFSVLNFGLVPMLVIVVGLAFFQYFTSDKLALRAAGAKVIERDQAPSCSTRSSVSPRWPSCRCRAVAIVDTDVPNAFATGRNPKNAVVAVTTGLMRRLDQPELEGVLAHELTHVKNRDVKPITLASFFVMLAARSRASPSTQPLRRRRDRDNNGVPSGWSCSSSRGFTYVISFVLIQLISRYREFAADRGAAVITGAPENLMSALQKIAGQMASTRSGTCARCRG